MNPKFFFWKAIVSGSRGKVGGEVAALIRQSDHMQLVGEWNRGQESSLTKPVNPVSRVFSTQSKGVLQKISQKSTLRGKTIYSS